MASLAHGRLKVRFLVTLETAASEGAESSTIVTGADILKKLSNFLGLNSTISPFLKTHLPWVSSWLSPARPARNASHVTTNMLGETPKCIFQKSDWKKIDAVFHLEPLFMPRSEVGRHFPRRSLTRRSAIKLPPAGKSWRPAIKGFTGTQILRIYCCKFLESHPQPLFCNILQHTCWEWISLGVSCGAASPLAATWRICGNRGSHTLWNFCRNKIEVLWSNILSHSSCWRALIVKFLPF